MSFAAPWFLLGLAAVPLLVWAYAVREQARGRAGAAFVSAPLRASVVQWRPGWRRQLPVLLAALALIVLLVALARPERTVAVPAEQARIILTNDTSGSMQATDVKPTRLAAVQHAASNFLDKVPRKVRVGAVVFDHRAHLAQTPTLDRTRVKQVIDTMKPHGGTATGDAMKVALDALKGRPGERRPPGAIVLLSDGKSISGSDPVAVAQEAKRLHIPIYTVALGTPQGTITVRGRAQPVPPDPQTLSRVAQISGGKSFNVQDAGKLDAVYKSLGSQVATKNEKREITPWLAGFALALLVASSIPQLRWFARPV
ncbi:MAG: Ca-activated chloride channel [Thermoleophilales bacterium]|nr:Ca-activated chloride channel [Thermoleophilales bacterium]